MARTRALDYDDKRAAILSCSARMFAQHGVDRATMAQIAAACGVSKALLYHYYQSKEDLTFDIIRQHLEALDAALADADDPAAAPEQRLRLLVRCTLETYRGRDDQHKIQLGGVAALPPDRAEVIRDIERGIVRRFAGILDAINPALSRDRPLLMPVTMSLFGMMNWVYMWFRADGPLSRRDYADLATRLILEGVRSVR